MGIGVLLKTFAPLTLYMSGLGCALIALGGNTRLALMMVAFLLPLRNVIERVQLFPGGNQFLDIMLIGVLIGGMFKARPPEDAAVKKSSINAIAIITVIYMLFSLFRGDYYLYNGLNFDIKDSRVQDWKNFALMPLLFFLNFKNNTTKKEVWTMFAVVCCGIFVSGYYTAHQIGWHSSLESRERIRGTFQFLGPNEVAAFFNGYTIILMSVLYGLKKGRNKTLLLILVLSNIYCITFLYSRGAYLGLMVGMFILFSLKDKKMLAPIFLVLLLWQTVLPQNVVDRIKETKTETGKLDESSQRRIDIWQQSMTYFKSSPITGIGFGSFRHLGLDLGDTHNIYIKILTEQGAIGIIILMITLFCFIKEGWQLYQKGDDELSKSMGLGFFCCIFVFMVNNLFGDRWSYLEPNAYLWVFAGLVARLNAIAQAAKAEEKLPPTAPLKAAKPGPAPEPSPKPKKRVRYYDPPQSSYEPS